MTTYNLLSIYCENPIAKETLENAFSLKLEKSIESSLCGQSDQLFVFYTKFKVLTIIHNSTEATLQAFNQLGIAIKSIDVEGGYIFQDYPIIIEENLSTPFEVANDNIKLPHASKLYLIIASLVISQSVALEHYENRVDENFSRSRTIIADPKSYTFLQRNKLLNFARKLTLLKHDMVNSLLLLDKPNILWENELAETFYNELSSMMELSERFETLDHKLSQMKDDVGMIMELINSKKSEFLEWIIIVLIAIEIIMSLSGHW